MNNLNLNTEYEICPINKVKDTFSYLSGDAESMQQLDDMFSRAEQWLNYQGIETRTEYGNLLPTYNLFLKIGEWLERRKTEERDE